MKCSLCRLEMTGAVMTIASLTVGGGGYAINIDRTCFADLIGRSSLRKVDNALVDAGWSQAPLPDPGAYGRGAD